MACKCKKYSSPKPDSNVHKHNNCGCEQTFYSPLPNLPVRPPTERVTPLDWFAPGTVQACCSICSTVKPVYANNCGYCSKNTNYSYNNTYNYAY